MKKYVGLKGTACIIVFVCHFFCAFLPGLKLGESSVSYFNGVDIWLGSKYWHPFEWMIGGGQAVCLFILLSCYFIMNSLMMTTDWKKKCSQIISTRYMRLALPILCSGIMVWVFQKLGLFCNLNTQNLFGGEWLEKYYSTPLSLIRVIYSCLISVLSTGDGSVNTVLWMMDYVFWGAFAAIILTLILKCFGKKSILLYILFGVLAVKVDTYYVAYFFAAVLIYAEHYFEFIRSKAIGIICFLIAFVSFNFTYVFSQTHQRMSVLIWCFGSFMLLMGFNLIGKQGGGQARIFGFLDDISFSVCLVHMPVLCSLSSCLMKLEISGGGGITQSNSPRFYYCQRQSLC